jgi:hypothetical protein
MSLSVDDVPASHVSLRKGKGQPFKHSSPDWRFQLFLIFASKIWNDATQLIYFETVLPKNNN